MTTSTQQHQRIAMAQAMLEGGLPTSSVAMRLQHELRISRATAYRIVHEAHKLIEASDDGPAQAELAAPLDPDTIEREFSYAMRLALAAGNVSDACKALKAIDTVKRWRGAGGPHSTFSG